MDNRPDNESPRLLRIVEPHAAIALWLTDATGTPGNDLLTVRATATVYGSRVETITGTGEEMADLARAILAHTEPAAQQAVKDAFALLEELRGAGFIPEEFEDKADAILAEAS